MKKASFKKNYWKKICFFYQKIYAGMMDFDINEYISLYEIVLADDATGFAQHVHRATPYQKDEALAYAVHYHNEGMVDRLLQAGAYANGARLRFFYHYPDVQGRSLQQLDVEGNTTTKKIGRVLHEAYENRDMGIVALLLDWQASLRYVYDLDMFPSRSTFLVAVTNNDQDMLDLFLHHGWDINERGLRVCNSKVYGLDTALNEACKQSINPMIEYLTQRNANPDLQSGYYNNVHECIDQNNRTGLRYLLHAGVDINVYDDEDMYTALGKAIQNYLTAVLGTVPHNRLPDPDEDDEVLLAGEFEYAYPEFDNYVHYDPLDPDDDQDEGNEIKRRRGIIKDLLKYNVDFDFPLRLNIHDILYFRDYSPLDVRRYIKLPAAIEVLLNTYRSRQQSEYLNTLAHDGSYNIGEAPPGHVDFVGPYGKTALQCAAENGHFEAVTTLVNKGANYNIPYKGHGVLRALELRYRDQRKKCNEGLGGPPFFKPPNPKFPTYRFEEGNAIMRAKLAVFQRIGRWLETRIKSDIYGRHTVRQHIEVKHDRGGDVIVEVNRMIRDFLSL